METLFKNKDTTSKINTVQFIETLADSLNFIGTAGMELVNIRKNNIKRNYSMLCKVSVGNVKVHRKIFIWG